MTKDEFIEKVSLLSQRVYSFDIKNISNVFIDKVINTYIEKNNISGLTELYQLIAASSKTLEYFTYACFNNATMFFRNPSLFGIFETKVSPNILSPKAKNNEAVNIWVAGCSTGEEPYSIAISLL